MKTIKYNNPIPVAVAMVPIEGTRNYLVIKRAIEPFIGQYALPGGYVNEGEDASMAASREFKEETGISLGAHCFMPTYIRVTSDNKLLIFMRSSFIIEKYWFNGYKFIPNSEVSEIEMSNNIGLDRIAFPLHREAIQRY